MTKKEKNATETIEPVQFWGMVQPIVPVSEPLEQYVSFNHIDIRMTLQQSRCVQRVRKALYDSNCKLRNGKHVNTFADTLRYVLERIEDGLEDFEKARMLK